MRQTSMSHVKYIIMNTLDNMYTHLLYMNRVPSTEVLSWKAVHTTMDKGKSIHVNAHVPMCMKYTAISIGVGTGAPGACAPPPPLFQSVP